MKIRRGEVWDRRSNREHSAVARNVNNEKISSVRLAKNDLAKYFAMCPSWSMGDCESVIILGSGCAGLTAAIYLSRAGLCPLVFDGNQPGGQLTGTSEVENFPGFPEGIDGYELVERMRKQAERFGAKFVGDSAQQLLPHENLHEREITLSGQTQTYRCSALVIATGSSPCKMNIPGEREYFGGGGVSTCATCDGAFYRGKTVAVLGGGDSAVEEALFLTRFCEKVYLVHRRDNLRASKIMAERALANKKIIPVWNAIAESIDGDGKKVIGLTVRNSTSGERSQISCSGVFVSIGHRPNSEFAAGVLKLDPHGYFCCDPKDEVLSSVPGIFLAGDCADSVYRQAVVAAGMGARAAIAAERWLRTG
ncbi:MAG: thioredoxin-disulfide reductase [Puniceicoccales bacterium]|jgi:thioredoxin reductase (NADPH)|nr:thioredoxin-disulfide reductase [Puniceicoccales bacterium]